MDRPAIPFGIVALLVGLGSGFAMVEYPEGLNPEWPIGIALLAPAVFVLGGLAMIGNGLGYSRFTGIMFAVVAVVLLAIANWAAFLTTHIQCREAISFLGVSILERYPDEAVCRDDVRIIVGCMDIVVLVPLIVFVWRKLSRTQESPAE